MRAETETQFRRLLEQHDRERLRTVTPDSRRALREQEWDTRFHEKYQQVVQPVLTRLRALMHDHGLRAEIVVAKRRTEAGSTVTPSSVAFEFQVLTDAETHGFPITTPTLTFIADAAQEVVRVQENSVLPFLGGHVGIIDQCPLDGLTGAFVEAHLLAIATKILRGTDVE